MLLVLDRCKMKELWRTDSARWIVKIVVAASCAVFSFHQILVDHYTVLNILLTLATAFICALWFLTKTEDENISYIRNHKCVTGMILIVAACYIWHEYESKGMLCRESIGAVQVCNLFRLRWYLFSILFLCYFGIWFYRKISYLLENIWGRLDAWDRHIYVGLTVVLSMTVLFVYACNQMWYLQYDHVYSIDSRWCFNEIFPKLTYYDIRHPILSVITFPIWSTTDSFLAFCAPKNLSELFCAVILQCLNVQFLLFTGILLKILTKSRYVFLLYIASFPTLLFSLSLEKYQMCVCLLVLYVYQKCMDEHNSGGIFILMTGIMPTNVFAGIFDFVTGAFSISKLKKLGNTFILGITVLICTGRIHLLYPMETYAELMAMKTSFGNDTLSTGEKMISVMNMMQSSFIAISSNVRGAYLWTSVTGGISCLCVIIIIMIGIGAVYNRNVKFVRIAFLWTIFSIVLFVVLNWAPHESPLFAILFSWALIPLFKLGVDWLIKKWGMHKKIVYGVIISVMLMINLAVLPDIHKFLIGCV